MAVPLAAKRSPLAFWIAVVMALACAAIIAVHGRALDWNPEDGPVSLVWVTAGIAILAILVHEFMESTRESKTPKAPLSDGDGQAEKARKDAEISRR